MGPFLSVIVASFLATIALDQDRTPDQVDRTTATVLAIGMIASAWVTSRVHHARAPGSLRPPPWARPLDLGFYGLLLFGTHWTTVAREATGDLPLLRQLLLLAPYFLAALARVDAAWPADHPEDHPWSRGRAVSFHARLLLIPILPLLLILALLDAVRRIGPLRATLGAYPVVESGAVLILLILTVTAMPVILTWLLRTKPLAPGSLRTALEGELARQGVRAGGIEEVDTGGFIANAAYLGLTLRTSRIFITDALLRLMPEDEIRAVFAHEVAHGTRRHLVWFMMFFVAVILGVNVAADLVLASPWVGGLTVAVPFIAGLVGFVTISRRFEVEADLVAAETLGDADLFNRALIRVGAIAGKPLDRHGLRHFAIGTRTAIVHACATDPGARAHWGRKIRAAKLAIVAVLVLTIAGVVWKIPDELQVGGAYRDWVAAESLREDERVFTQRDGKRAAEEKALADAIVSERLRSAIDRARQALAHPAVRNRAAIVGIGASMALADEALARGDFDEARRIAADVEANWPAGDPIGDFNRKMLKAELAAIDPSRDLASVRPEVTAALDGFRELMKSYPPNASSELVEQELHFLAAATGVEGASLGYDSESFESSRLLALARGAQLPASEPREAAFKRALATWAENDSAWRRRVLEKALGKQAHEIILVAAETRRGA